MKKVKEESEGAVQLSGCESTSGPEGGRKGRLDGLEKPEREKAKAKASLPGWKLKKLTISGGNDEGVPPVPIPNTEVKPFSADGT